MSIASVKDLEYTIARFELCKVCGVLIRRGVRIERGSCYCPRCPEGCSVCGQPDCSYCY